MSNLWKDRATESSLPKQMELCRHRWKRSPNSPPGRMPVLRGLQNCQKKHRAQDQCWRHPSAWWRSLSTQQSPKMTKQITKNQFFLFRLNSAYVDWDLLCTVRRVRNPLDKNLTKSIKPAVLPPGTRIPPCLANDIQPLGGTNHVLWARLWQTRATKERVGLCPVRKWEESVFCLWERKTKGRGRGNERREKRSAKIRNQGDSSSQWQRSFQKWEY